MKIHRKLRTRCWSSEQLQENDNTEDLLHSRAGSTGNENQGSLVDTIIENRARFKMMSRLLVPLSDCLELSFKDGHWRDCGGINRAIQYNIFAAIRKDADKLCVDYQKLIVSCGTLPGAFYSSLEFDVDGSLKIKWEDDPESPQGNDTDMAYVILFDSLTDHFIKLAGPVLRPQRYLCVDVSNLDCAIIEAFLFFVSADERYISRSQYIGNITLES